MNAKSGNKLSIEGAKFLRARRLALGLSMAEVAFKTGLLSLNQMAIFKIEKRVKGIRLCDVQALSRAYGVGAEEILKFTSYTAEEYADYREVKSSEPSTLGELNLSKVVTIDDLKFLVGISEGLGAPLNLGQVVQLLNKR